MKNEIVILMPNYNDARGLKKSLSVISAHEEIDVLIVDDGSTSDLLNEAELQASFKGKGQLYFLYMKENGGITKALNFGLEYLKNKEYKYIARLDAGDICLNDRFQVQADFLRNNPDIYLVGSNIIVKDLQGNFLFNIKVPTDPSQMKNRMFVSSSTVIHPTIMFKTEILTKISSYPTKYYTEDYAFYFEVLKYFRISNIDQFLLEKELNPNSMSLKNRKRQASARLAVIKDNFYFGFYPVYGFIRNYILYLVPNSTIISIKKIFFR
ncbi:MAG: glycosyltransferase [Flavobacterium psychrophilum]